MQLLIDFAHQHISPTPAQQEALQALDLFLNSQQRCFLLKGYAGTGKTFLTRIIAQYLRQCNKPVALMAPTGRAARVLSDKTGFTATTIHKAIYNLDLRRQRFAEPLQIEPDDTLMIVQNNYNYEIELFNGTLIKVLKVDSNPEIKAGMLSYNHNGDDTETDIEERDETGCGNFFDGEHGNHLNTENYE